ncbi:uncharacterized protein LOC143340127 [Chaetodon auriga]|uniref:uncharacterized protein LOC143340127 n=1 Tax=Chaetodon auriga TaxID=39042 RepID=UPI0040330D9B
MGLILQVPTTMTMDHLSRRPLKNEDGFNSATNSTTNSTANSTTLDGIQEQTENTVGIALPPPADGDDTKGSRGSRALLEIVKTQPPTVAGIWYPFDSDRDFLPKQTDRNVNQGKEN